MAIDPLVVFQIRTLCSPASSLIVILRMGPCVHWHFLLWPFFGCTFRAFSSSCCDVMVIAVVIGLRWGLSREGAMFCGVH